MGTTTTVVAGERRQDAARTPKKRALAASSARLLSWKSVLVQSLGRELHALHIQQQERAFMATSHGLNYTVLKLAGHSEGTALH
jgi:hypothetical protein